MTLPPVPPPPPPNIPRFRPDGRPTTAQVTFDQDMQQFLKAVKAAVEAS